MSPESLHGALQAAQQYHRTGQIQQAESIYRRILQEHPEHPDAMHLLGVVAHQCGLHDEALALMQRSIAIAPAVPYYYKNLGEVFRAKGQLEDALSAFRKAVELVPNDGHGHHCIGITQEKLGRIDEAIAAYRRAIELSPDHAIAHLNLGVQLERRGQYDDAMRLYNRAIEVRPDYPLARMARATALLRLGEYETGWREYEWRWKVPPFSHRAPDPYHPVWNGSNLAGRTILLRFEQGMGDTLQFIRYAPLVAQRGGRVILEVQPPLKSLLSRMQGVAAAYAAGQEALPPFDLQVPLMSLPRIFGTTPGTIPAVSPYLTADPARVDAWRQRLGNEPGCKVGLVWAGNPTYPNDRNRSIRLDVLSPLASVTGVTFYSLQKGDPASQAARPPAGMCLIDLTADLTSFAETAALVSCLDLVITVDTSVAHLAGGMGRPVWTLVPFVPDFRWFLGREETPWYPTMRLFRQSSIGDWETPVRRMASDLGSRIQAGDKPALQG